MPERELLFAVIQKAIEDSKIDLSKIRNENKRIEMTDLKEAAQRWLFVKDDRLKSFQWYCDLLSIDPDSIREGLKGGENA